jgi:putative ATPase
VLFTKPAEKGKAILFIDEIHRFNKAQQDALLGAVEKGSIILFGATTENPSFEVISALLSRCQVYVLKPLGARRFRKAD